MAKIFIFHGYDGSPEGNWFPWLKDELQKLGHDVVVPRFPDPQHPKLDAWLAHMDGYDIPEDAILVGHSLGCPFILKLLEKRKAAAAFMVAGFFGRIGKDIDKEIYDIADRNFDWTTIRANCSRFFAYHSDDDPYLPLRLGIALAQKLGTRLILVKGAGHLNSASGYDRFDQLLEDIKTIL